MRYSHVRQGVWVQQAITVFPWDHSLDAIERAAASGRGVAVLANPFEAERLVWCIDTTKEGHDHVEVFFPDNKAAKKFVVRWTGPGVDAREEHSQDFLYLPSVAGIPFFIYSPPGLRILRVRQERPGHVSPDHPRGRQEPAATDRLTPAVTQ